MFWLFITLFRHFTLSSVAHGSGFDEINRFISKVLYFMPSGSIFENLQKIHRTSIEHLSNIYRKSIELRSTGGLLSGDCGDTLGSLWNQIGATLGLNLVHEGDFGALCEPFRHRKALDRTCDGYMCGLDEAEKRKC